MRIAINCRSALKKTPTGIGRYTTNLIRHLAAVATQDECLMYTPLRWLDVKRRVMTPPSPNFRVVRDPWLKGPGVLAAERIDLYHAPSFEPWPDLDVPVVMTVHDLIHRTFPEGHDPSTRDLVEQQLTAAVAKAAALICCSEATARDLAAAFPRSRGKIHVIPQGVDHETFRPAVRGETGRARTVLRRLEVTRPYILFVGTLEPRKNLARVIRAVAALYDRGAFKGMLVVVGAKGWGDPTWEEVHRRSGLKDRVRFLGYVSDEMLAVLYQNAACLAFPSHYEGFGFPILEAMACGTPVLTSNRSSCAEVAGEAAVLVDPDSMEEIAYGLNKILKSESLRRRLIQEGFKQAARFTFDNTARRTHEVYRRVHQQHLAAGR